jgi:hypothetical protein
MFFVCYAGKKKKCLVQVRFTLCNLSLRNVSNWKLNWKLRQRIEHWIEHLYWMISIFRWIVSNSTLLAVLYLATRIQTYLIIMLLIAYKWSISHNLSEIKKKMQWINIANPLISGIQKCFNDGQVHELSSEILACPMKKCPGSHC